jgi:hypothetical protein
VLSKLCHFVKLVTFYYWNLYATASSPALHNYRILRHADIQGGGSLCWPGVQIRLFANKWFCLYYILDIFLVACNASSRQVQGNLESVDNYSIEGCMTWIWVGVWYAVLKACTCAFCNILLSKIYMGFMGLSLDVLLQLGRCIAEDGSLTWLVIWVLCCLVCWKRGGGFVSYLLRWVLL